MQLPTVKIRNKATGKIRIVNQTKYADNIAAFMGWEILSMRGGMASDQLVASERAQEQIEMVRARNPNSPAYSDPQRAFEARSGYTINTTAESSEEQPFAADVTSAVSVESQESPVEMREVPVIGGSQTVRVRGRKPKSPQDEGSVL
jgi:hypothetical protein